MKMQGCLSGVISLGLLLGLGSVASAQQPDRSSEGTPHSTAVPSETEKTKPPLTPEEKKRAELRADTEKLYRLTQELKVEVDKSNKDTLSVSVIKKAQEIERLAKSIKERSKNQ